MKPIPSSAAVPTAAEMLDETVSLVCVMAIYGPPVVFVAAPWLLLALLLSGPFALVMTLVLALLAATALVVGILAMPYLIIRSFRSLHASITRRAPARGQVELRGVVA